jgi:hypothetical protein
MRQQCRKGFRLKAAGLLEVLDEMVLTTATSHCNERYLELIFGKERGRGAPLVV